MNYSAGSEWKSGCESGWTCYLQESSYNHVYNNNDHHYHLNKNHYESNWTSRNNCYDNSEVDMSMVSDASSGPPQLLHDDEHDKTVKNKKNVREKKSNKVPKEKKKLDKYQHHYNYEGYYDTINSITNLDDTASSPIITYSKIQGDSTFNSQRDCWQYSHRRGTDFAEPSHFGGRRFKD